MLINFFNIRYPTSTGRDEAFLIRNFTLLFAIATCIIQRLESQYHIYINQIYNMEKDNVNQKISSVASLLRMLGFFLVWLRMLGLRKNFSTQLSEKNIFLNITDIIIWREDTLWALVQMNRNLFLPQIHFYWTGPRFKLT